MPKLPIKKTRNLAKAKREGELKAEVEHKFKLFRNKKHIWVAISDQMEKALSNIDTMEFIAIGGLTVLIKQGIEWTEDIPTTIYQKDSLIRTLMRMTPIASLIEGFIPSFPPEAQEAIKRALDSPQAELIQWVISFVVAFILVRHAGEIIQGGGALLGVARGLIGVLAVA